MASFAVSLDRVSAVLGYELKANLEGMAPPFLPMRVIVLGQKSTANESVSTSKLSFTNCSEIGKEYGYKSQLYSAARILRPLLGGNPLGSMETICIPVDAPIGGTASINTVAISGTATKNGTHSIRLNGRTSLDGQSFSFSVIKGDGAAEISQKMIDAVNNVLGACVTGTLSTNDAVFTAGWVGLSSNEINIEIETNGDNAGLTYTVTTTAGTGKVSITSALAQIGNEWSTLLVNCFGQDVDVLDAIEVFNGTADTKTGRYDANDWKPLLAFFGDSSLKTVSSISTVVNARALEQTNVFCPSPGSKGTGWEAAANGCVLQAKTSHETPNVDIIGMTYPDMPVGEDIGDFADVNKRDQIVKLGCSTVQLNAGKYEIIDFVTTNHPSDEPQTAVRYRWVSDLIKDFNIKFIYFIFLNIYVKGKTLVNNDFTGSAPNTISVDRWKGILINDFAPLLIDAGIMTDLEHFKNTLVVNISPSNPNRFETTFKGKITGTARVLATTNERQFNF